MGQRPQKVSEQILSVLANCFVGGQMNDPRLLGISITAVKLTLDLQLAYIYFRLYENDSDKIRSAKVGLRGAEGFFRYRLSQNLDVKRVPRLKFFYDNAIEHASHIEKIFDQIQSNNTDG